MRPEAEHALRAFGIQGAIDEVALFGSGHINDSYSVAVGNQLYFLQRINTQVFPNPSGIEENLVSLLSTEASLFVPHYKAGGRFHFEHENGVWRLTAFMGDCFSPQSAKEANLSQVGLGFGQFIKVASGLNPADFKEVIPRFHDLEWRWEQLLEALQDDMASRASGVSHLIDQAKAAYKDLKQEKESLVHNGLSVRICHNDCKINNCLLSKTDKSLRHIIDLDTVGPGYLFYDFGDLIRTSITGTPENEPDLDQIKINLDIFRELSTGFFDACGQHITAVERQSLVFGGLYMTYIMGVRFLADYLNGDIYYKTSYAEENSIRARNQFKLLEELQQMRADLEKMINK